MKKYYVFMIIQAFNIALAYAATKEERLAELEYVALYEPSDWIDENEVIPTPDDAKKKIDKIDKSRAAYCKYYTGNEWNDPANYDLCINTTKVGFDGAVDIIIDYMKRKGINV